MLVLILWGESIHLFLNGNAIIDVCQKGIIGSSVVLTNQLFVEYNV